MTAVLEASDAPPAPAPGFPYLDLRLVQLVVEQAAGAADTDDGLPSTVLIDRIALVETLQHTLAALQATQTRRFARAHVAEQTSGPDADQVSPEKLERSVAGQVALACRISPTRARQRVRAARDLHDGLDHVRGLFAAGELSPAAVDAVVRATRHLDHDERAEVDRRLAAHDLPRLGRGRIRDLARRLAAEVAPEKFRARVTAARADRRVTLRPGEDGMSWLTAHLPVEQGAACYAALDRAHRDLSANPEPLTRGRGQVMADTRQGEHADRASRGRPPPTRSRWRSRPWCRSKRSSTPTVRCPPRSPDADRCHWICSPAPPAPRSCGVWSPAPAS